MSSTTSDDEKPKVVSRGATFVLKRPQKLIAAAGKRGRYPERDKLLAPGLSARLRASEAVGLRWDASTSMAGL